MILEILAPARIESVWSIFDSNEVNLRNDFEKMYEKLFTNGEVWLSPQWPQPKVLTEINSWGFDALWKIPVKVSADAYGWDSRKCIEISLKKVKKTLGNISANVVSIPIIRRATPEANVCVTDNASASKAKDELVQPLPYIQFSGQGIIKTLATMQNPLHGDYDSQRAKFELIVQFLRQVTGDSSAEIHIPHTQQQILAKFRGQPFFPLEDLGDGIHQVVLHATVATSIENSIVTFEEPEQNLHPTLQKQLLRYLSENTSNQYFIATHSAQIIENENAHVFHVQMVDGETSVSFAETSGAKFNACLDLGCRASDILQSNCVIWVEGPSDRIYANHWIKICDEDLREDVHYSIMFYGGRLLSRLTAAIEEEIANHGLDDLIKLVRINRNMVVIMDSDLKKESGVPNATKQRVKKEMDEYEHGLSWITEGREIENYAPEGVLRNAVNAIKPGLGDTLKNGKFRNLLPKKNGKTVVDKVKVASEVAKLTAKKPVSSWKYDLATRVQELCNFIRTANGIPLLLTATPAVPQAVAQVPDQA